MNLNSTTTLGLIVSLITGLGIVLATFYNGRRDKDSIVKEVYEQRLKLKDEIIERKDTSYKETLAAKDEVIRNLLREIKLMSQLKRQLMELEVEDDSTS